MPKLIHLKNKCINCGLCVSLASKFFKIEKDGTVSLKNGKEVKKNRFELEINQKDVEKLKEVVESCPANAIKLE